MSFSSRLFRSAPSLVAVAAFLAALYVTPAAAQVTTITGKVYSPLGAPPLGTGDPIPNILVYVAQTAVLPFPGQGPGTSCQNQYGIVSGNPLVEALTAADGSYTLSSPNMPNPATIVIQAGKWRRQYQNIALTTGGTTTLNMAMPSGQSATSDLPHIAVVTGSADAIECIFGQIGINTTGTTSEITDPTGTGSINLFAGNYSTGEVVSSSSPKEIDLMGNSALLQTYDLVMFGCQGNATDTVVSNDTDSALENLLGYANNGGRIFATHYEYNWLQSPKTFQSVADWTGTTQNLSTSGTTLTPATINNSATFPQGVTLAAWMQDIGALVSNPPPVVDLTNVRANTSAVYSPATSWVNLNNSPCTGNTTSCYTGNPSMQFTFDTPIGASGVPTVVLAYSASSANFLLGDTADTVTVDVTNNSNASANSSLTLSISLPPGLTATSLTDASGGDWTCAVGSPASSCSRSTPLAAGTSDNVTLVFSIATTTTLGQATIVSSLAGGGLSNSGQCGRVLYNDYHVEPPASGSKYYPSACPSQTKLSNTQKFLEYSLYNLSNFVSPTTSDIILIQSATTTTLTNSTATVYYGQSIANSAVASVIGTSGSAVDGGTISFLINGTVVCTYSATTSASCPASFGQGYSSGTYTIQAAYSGDPLYLASNSSTVTEVVQPDLTTTSVASSLNPATVQQAITFTANSIGNYATPTGSIAFFDNNIQIGTGTVNAGSASITLFLKIPGTHTITACLVASTNFLASCSTGVTEIVALPVSPDTTETLLRSNVNPSVVGQAITFSSSVATTGSFIATPTGTLTFYDGTTPIGTATLDSSGNGSLTTSTLALGTHTITSAYTGTSTMVPSVSTPLTQIVTEPLTAIASGFQMTVAPTTFSVGAGSGISLSVSILELNNFNQAIQLSCTGQPSETQCIFDQPLMPNTGSTRLTITPASAHGCNSSTPYFIAGSGGTGLIWLGATGLLLFMARKRRRLLQGIALAAALCILPALQGCGGGNCTDFGVKPGTYTFTVTGTSTGTPVVVQTQKVTMTVTIN